MKVLKTLVAVALVAGCVQQVSAQVVKKKSGDDAQKAKSAQITTRQQSFYEVNEPHDADLQWMKVVYRSLDLTKGKNPALYYPDEPHADGQDLFFIIMRQSRSPRCKPRISISAEARFVASGTLYVSQRWMVCTMR